MYAKLIESKVDSVELKNVMNYLLNNIDSHLEKGNENFKSINSDILSDLTKNSITNQKVIIDAIDEHIYQKYGEYACAASEIYYYIVINENDNTFDYSYFKIKLNNTCFSLDELFCKYIKNSISRIFKRERYFMCTHGEAFLFKHHRKLSPETEQLLNNYTVEDWRKHGVTNVLTFYLD